jgi:hypothetical protein
MSYSLEEIFFEAANVPYRTKTYIAFDGDEDLSCYRVIQMWHANKNIDFEFLDAHEINDARDDSKTESIIRQLKERLDKSRHIALIVSEQTNKNRKGILEYEINYAIRNKLPIFMLYKDYDADSAHDWGEDLEPKIPKVLRDAEKDDKNVLVSPFTLASLKGAIQKYDHKNLPGAGYTWFWK